jgi:hypothetical protein
MEFYEIVSLIDRATERILTLVDVGEIPDDHRIEVLVSLNREIRKFSKLNLDLSLEGNLGDLRTLAQVIDSASVALPDVGKHGRQLAEEMNLISSKIRRILHERS